MTRTPLTDRALIAFAAANAAGVLLLPPAAFVWQLAVDLLVGAAALGVMYVAADQRAEAVETENLELRIRILDLQQANRALNTENTRLHLKLTEAERAAGLGADVVAVPLLRVVPPQRDGSEYEWPAIVRAVEGETGATS